MAAVAIKERILRRIRELTAAISGVAAVVRFSASGRWWDGSGFIDTLEDTRAMVVCMGESMLVESMGGASAIVTKRMIVSIGVVIARPEDEHVFTDSYVNDWKAKLEQAILSDERITEAGTPLSGVAGQKLAIETRFSDSPDIVTAEAQRETNGVVLFEVDYQHERNNTFRCGTIIPTWTE